MKGPQANTASGAPGANATADEVSIARTGNDHYKVSVKWRFTPLRFQRHAERYHPTMTVDAPRSIRTVLLVGFGLTLGLWLFSGYYFTRRVTELQSRSAQVTQRYIRAQTQMSTVRSQVLLISVYARDALLDPRPESILDYRQHIDDAFQAMKRALTEYEPVLGTASESDRVQQLRTRIEEFQLAILDVLGSDSTTWRDTALMILRDRIMPKREQAMRVSEDVQSINRAAYIDQQSATSSIYELTQRRIWTQFGLAVAASFFIGLLAVKYAARLEREIREQQARGAKNTADLQRLSAQLLTAQEDERRTIARELHDEVGQALTAIKVELAVAEGAMGTASGSEPLLATARGLTESALQTVRDLSRLLHPAVLDDIGLTAAIETYVREFRKRYVVTVDFVHELPAEIRLEAGAEAAAYRIVQEALTNVARHAQASRCCVSLRRIDDTIRLAVEDDGRGFDAERERNGPGERGLGLLGMQERVGRLGGTCRVDSAPGKGTRVEINLPIGGSAQILTMTQPEALIGGFADASSPQHRRAGAVRQA
jgi:signal transduction histidine kinase